MRKKRLTMWLGLALAGLTATAQQPQDTLKYRISLTDKAATTYSIDKPEEFLSAKSIARRQRQGLPIDSTDLPVCKKYVDELRQTGAHIVLTGKWENFVTVSLSDPQVLARIEKLPFVGKVEEVWVMPHKKPTEAKRDTLKEHITLCGADSLYGKATAQIQMSHGDRLHQAGFKGEGMTIGVIDAGYHNADRISSMQNIRVLGTKDFVAPDGDIYAEHSHGMMVLSCMAMNKPRYMVGTAPEASYWLLRSEDGASEQPVEEDYWAAAVEYADSVGVDLINTSLGYFVYDDKSKSYKYCQLDGRTSLMTRQAARAADKGIVLVCAAGNEGDGTWKKITPPADADNVLTVGAIDKNGTLALFSSLGNTADGRIKPDVVAVGHQSTVMNTDGNLHHANGTSFASPTMCGMVACLWQALPHLTAKQIIELVRRSGDRADCPDNVYGYGVPNLWKAYQEAKGNQ